MSDWFPFFIACWALPAGALLYIEAPFRKEIGEWRYWRDCLAWPWWLLVIIVEVTEEARRGNLRK